MDIRRTNCPCPIKADLALKNTLSRPGGRWGRNRGTGARTGRLSEKSVAFKSSLGAVHPPQRAVHTHMLITSDALELEPSTKRNKGEI